MTTAVYRPSTPPKLEEGEEEEDIKTECIADLIDLSKRVDDVDEMDWLSYKGGPIHLYAENVTEP